MMMDEDAFARVDAEVDAGTGGHDDAVATATATAAGMGMVSAPAVALTDAAFVDVGAAAFGTAFASAGPSQAHKLGKRKRAASAKKREGGGFGKKKSAVGWWVDDPKRGQTILTQRQVVQLAARLPYGYEYMGLDGPIGYVSRNGVLYGRTPEDEKRAQEAAASAQRGMGGTSTSKASLVGGRKEAKRPKGGGAKGKSNARGGAHEGLHESLFDHLHMGAHEGANGGAHGGIFGGAQEPARAELFKRPVSSAQSKRAKAEERAKRMDLRKRLLELQTLLTNLEERATSLIDERDELSLAAQRANVHVQAIDSKRKTSAVSRGVSQLRQKISAKPDTQIGFDTLRYRCLIEVVHKQCLTAVRQLISHKWGFPFATAVDPDALGLPTYREIVKEPMDLGTIKNLIEKGGKYVVAEDVDKDVRLTFANAMLFNAEGTDVHTMARELLVEWEAKWVTIQQRIQDVEACLLVERELAEAKNDAAARRADVVNKEKECAKATEALDIVTNQIREVESQTISLIRPILREERLNLASDLRSLSDGLRVGAESIVAKNTSSFAAQAHLEDVDAHSDLTLHLLIRYAKAMHRSRLAVVAGWCGNATPEALLEKFKQEPEVSDNTAMANFMIGHPLDDATSDFAIQSIEDMDAIPDDLDFDPLAFSELLDGVPLDVADGAMDLDLGL